MFTKKTVFFSLLTTVLIVSASFADMSVSLPQVDVTDIPLGTPTTVTVSAQIGADPALMLDRVRLVSYDPATNRPLAVLGQMYDDGTHGDALPGDTRFTAQVIFTTTEAGPIHLRVTAAYRRVRNRFMSDVIELNAFAPLTQQDFDTADDVMDWAMNLFDTISQTLPEDEAAQQTLDAVLADSEIANAGIYGNWLVMEMSSGMLQVVVVGDESEIDGTSNTVGILQMLVPTMLSAIDAERVPGNANLMIWAPGYSDASPQDGIADYARTRFENAAWFISNPSPPVITSDTAASLETVKDFDEYGTIIIHTHGGWMPNRSTADPDDRWVCLRSGTLINDTTNATYATDLRLQRLYRSSSGKFGFTPRFVSQYVSNMPDSVIYLGACHSLQNDSLWDSFRNAGAKVSFGWSESVCRGFNTATFSSLLDSLLPTTETTDPSTVQQAYDAIANKVDPGCSNPTFLIRTDGAAWQNMYLVTPDIVNGGFETGDFSGWITGGDYDYSAVVSHSHEGGYSGALGRWDQGYLGYNPNVEPYGYEWLYQDVLVPSNATKLSFWYDIETYDTAVWDWVDMQIRSESGSVLTTVLSHAGKPGTNYGPYWHLGWTYVETNVTAYRGQKIRIYFAQRLDGWGDQQRCYFDDVKFIKE